MADKSFIGKGKWYAQPYDLSGPARFLGNVGEATLSHDFEEKTQKDFTSAGGGEVNSLERLTAVRLAIKMLEFTPHNVAAGTQGAVTAETSVVAIVDEAHDAVQKGTTGGFVKTDRIIDTTVPPTVKVAPSTGKNLGTDFSYSAGGIFIPAGSTIADDDDLLISYTPVASDRIEAMVEPSKEYVFIFDGLNEADSGKPVLLVARRVKVPAAAQLALIGDDFGDITVNCKVLKDTTVAAVGTSAFYYFQWAR